MNPGARLARVLLPALMLWLGGAAASVAAPVPPPPVTTIHPIFAAADVPQTDTAHQQFSAATARRQMGAVEVMDIPGPPAPRAKALLTAGRTAVEGKRFTEAETALSAAANEVAATGAAGLTSDELADVFLYLGMTLQKADWKDAPTPYTEITPPAAKVAYERAAVLAGDRKLLPRQFPPLAIEAWRLATATVAKRSRSNLVVRVPSSALVSIDGAPLKSGLLPTLELVQGDHWVRVEDPGRRPYGALVSLNTPAREIEVPAQPVRALADAGPAAQARRQGAAFALVAELRPGPPVMLELRLLHAQSGKRRDGTVVSVGDASALEAAVMRLEEVARKERFDDTKAAVISAPALGNLALGPVGARADAETSARLADSPGAWVKARWPVLTAVGVAVGSALVLGVMVAHDSGR